jgi:YVTN family beta-propeller protein
MRRSVLRSFRVSATVLTGCAGLLTGGLASAGAASAGSVALAAGSAPVAGANLLRNPGAEVGAASVQGWDSVTIPAWTIVRGLPTVVRYGTAGFPAASGSFPAARDGQLFAGGLGGSAVLRQVVRLTSPSRGAVARGPRFTLSAWLGATKSSRASVTVWFRSAKGRVLGRASIGPVGLVGSLGHRRLARRAVTGRIPSGAVSAQVDLRLATTLPGADGGNSPYVGYDKAIADDLRFSLRAPVHRPAPIRPPVARVPGYQHVFLFYFENQDFRSIIGNTKKAPYLNSLLPKASLLANLYAEAHPSDANYLALAGGSAFGIPPTDPLEVNPRYTINAPNIADLITGAHKSWKSYLQSANGPCDDTVHNQYWDDDLPFLYFSDIRDRPAYCSAHVQPLEALPTDLARAATTPSFAWIGADDCSDMEGCGVRAGDSFLADELGAIVRSPAWRTQRSLAIITFDEDNYDDPHPPQRVPTIMLASSGVKSGYTSAVRYTHYSLLRTIEAALGLGTLTANDRYAQPVNDVFSSRPVAGSRSVLTPGTRNSEVTHGTGPSSRPALPAPPARSKSGTASRVRVEAGRSAGPGQVGFVANSESGSVTPVDLRTHRAGKAIKVGADPVAVVAAPDGRTVYVASAGAGTVTPIDAVTRRAGRPIRVGADPRALAVTPDGRTLLVANSGSGTVTPISTRTARTGRPIRVGANPRAIVMAPSGKLALVLDWGSGQVTPINPVSRRVGRPIRVGGYPFAAAFGPGGRIAYVASFGSDTVTPVDLKTGRPGRPIRVGGGPDSLAVSKDGSKVFVVNGNSESVSVIAVGSGRVVRSIKGGYSPSAIALTGSGGTGYVVSTISGTVARFATRTGRLSVPLNVGTYSYPTSISVDRRLGVAAVIDTYSGQLSLINLTTGHVIAPITVGSFPDAIAFAR